MKRKFVTVVLFLLPFLAFCQEKVKEKAGFHSILAVGGIGGNTRAKFLYQYSAGVSFSRYFAGVGIGYDTYRFNTIPVFADWRINFAKNKVLFVYGNIGANMGADSKLKKDEFTTTRIRPGLYTDAGFGYRIRLQGSHLVSLSVGHSLKKITQVDKFNYPCGIIPCNNESATDYYHYKFNCMVVKAAWEFGK